ICGARNISTKVWRGRRLFHDPCLLFQCRRQVVNLVHRVYFYRRRCTAALLRLLEGLGRPHKRMMLLVADIIVINLALVMALSLSLNRLVGAEDLTQAALLFPALSLVGGVLGWGLGLPKIKLNSYDWHAIVRTAAFAALMTAGGLAIDRNFASQVPASLFYAYGLILFALFVLGRITMLHLVLGIYRRGVEQRRVLIYGAGATGMQLAAALSTHGAIDAVAFID